MPGLPEEMYCSQQIHIPPTYPYLLRQYAKAAIRTQPTDLLRWSYAYFKALSDGLEPPTKPRLEYPEPRNHKGLTPGFLKVLIKQFSPTTTVDLISLAEIWNGICLDSSDLIRMLLLGNFKDPNAIPWDNFLALAAGHLNDTLIDTLVMVCELLTEEPEGGSATIPVQVLLDVFDFLAKTDAAQVVKLRNDKFLVPESSIVRPPAAPQPAENEEKMPVKDDIMENNDESIKSGRNTVTHESEKSEKELSISVKSEKDCSAKSDASEKSEKLEYATKSIGSSNKSESVKFSIATQEGENLDKSGLIQVKSPKKNVPLVRISALFEESKKCKEYIVQAVRGIGPVLEDEVIESFVKYIEDTGKEQCGMIMPRNLKHFLCPSVETAIEDNVSLPESSCVCNSLCSIEKM